MGRMRRTAVLVAAGIAIAAVARRVRHEAIGHPADGGIVIGDVRGYDRHTGRLLRGFYRGVAADVADLAGTMAADARVLDIGCGPGHLSIILAGAYGLDVTGLDLDPRMVDQARLNAEMAAGRRPAFVVGDVSALPFADESFDVVVSTISMHHWADPDAGLAEIARVLAPGGRGLVWDFRQGLIPFHVGLRNPADIAAGAPVRVVRADGWAWPWRLKLTQRVEIARPD